MLRIALRGKRQRLPPEPPLLFALGDARCPRGFSDPLLLAQGKENLPGTPLYAGWEEGRTRKPDEPLFSIAVLSSPQIREEPFFMPARAGMDMAPKVYQFGNRHVKGTHVGAELGPT